MRALMLALVVLAGCATDDVDAWVSVSRGDLVFTADVTGTLEAVDSTAISPPHIHRTWSFKISRMAPEGAEVKKGDMVIAFDVSTLARTLQEMKNKASAAQEKLDKTRGEAAMAKRDGELKIAEAQAKLKTARLKAEVDPRLAAANVHRLALLDLQLAERELAHAQARAEQTRRRDRANLKAQAADLEYYRGRVAEIGQSIGRMTVTAPRPGTVVYPTNEEGEKKAVGDTVWRMQTAIEVVSLDEMIGNGHIDEAEASKVETGQRVRLRLDAHPSKELLGHVATIDSTVRAQSETNPNKVVSLEIALEDTHDLALSPGMRFRGKVETGRAGDVVLIPVEAVFVTDGGPVAYVRTDSGYKTATLSLGHRGRDRIEVLSGVSPGDQVSRIDLEAGAP